MTFCMGVTSILGLLCFFLFSRRQRLRKSVFQYFCYLLMFHYSIIHTELPFVKWFVPERPWLVEYAWYLMTNLLSVFFVLFVRSFVNLREHSKRWDQIAIFVLASSLFCLTLYHSIMTLLAIKFRVVKWAGIRMYTYFGDQNCFFTWIPIKIVAFGSIWCWYLVFWVSSQIWAILEGFTLAYWSIQNDGHLYLWFSL